MMVIAWSAIAVAVYAKLRSRQTGDEVWLWIGLVAAIVAVVAVLAVVYAVGSGSRYGSPGG